MATVQKQWSFSIEPGQELAGQARRAHRFLRHISDHRSNYVPLDRLPWTVICLGYRSMVVHFRTPAGNLQTSLLLGDSWRGSE